jgi:hypothetical protein
LGWLLDQQLAEAPRQEIDLAKGDQIAQNWGVTDDRHGPGTSPQTSRSAETSSKVGAGQAVDHVDPQVVDLVAVGGAGDALVGDQLGVDIEQEARWPGRLGPRSASPSTDANS